MDPHGVAGPQGILAICNNGIVYHNKDGTTNWSVIPEANFFLPTICCDAKGVFDPISQRFFVIAQQSTPFTNSVATNLFVNVSRSAHPLSGGTNDWMKYVFTTGVGNDYPGIGIDAQALYVTYANSASWYVLNKAQLLSGSTNVSPLARVFVGSPPVYNQGFQAVSVIGSQNPGDVAYAVTMGTPTSVTLYAISNVLGTRTLFITNVPAPFYGNGNLALFSPQPGTATRLHSGFPVVMGNAFWRNGELWLCNTVASSNQPERTLVRWYKLGTGGFPNGQATLAEWGDLDGGANTWRNHSAIGGNARGDVCVTFTQSATNAFSSFRAALRLAGQSSFDEVLIRASAGALTTVLFTNNGLLAARWADYCVVSPDPEDQTFWVSHLTIPSNNQVLTWWANITRDSLFYVDKNAVGPEAGIREFPWHSVRLAHTVTSGPKTFVIKPADYPEPTLPLRLDKNVRLENPYPTGTVRIGP
jgi:hypothetical protein